MGKTVATFPLLLQTKVKSEVFNIVTSKESEPRSVLNPTYVPTIPTYSQQSPHIPFYSSFHNFPTSQHQPAKNSKSQTISINTAEKNL